MDTESVIEFLGGVPLLQRLPSSSLKKIAEVIKVKHYEAGEYVLRSGEVGDGLYFIFEGKAEVSGSSDEVSREEYQFYRYDYFGNMSGVLISSQQADVMASSKLTCLVLPHEHRALLQTNSIWSAGERHGTCAVVESVLHVQPIEVNIFQGITIPEAVNFGKVFGGQFIGQALAAATKTVDCLKVVHHLQAYFLLTGDHNIPIIYEVHRIRDGKSFTTRRVDAIQKGNVVFTLLASFQKDEIGFDHQDIVMPLVPPPDKLLSMEELRERRITDPRLPRTYRNKVATAEFRPWPIEIRFCEPNTSTNQTKSPPSLRFWFRIKGKLSDDPALHSWAGVTIYGLAHALATRIIFNIIPQSLKDVLCAVAYASDLLFIEVSSNPHRRQGLKISCLSLNHTMWFHRSVKADDWLLFDIHSPSAFNARGLVTGQMFNQKGQLVVSLVQEGLLRKAKMLNATLRAKY